MTVIDDIPIRDIETARSRLAPLGVRSPLVRLNVDDAPAEIYLKLENLQPIGSFKLRGAGNAMLLAGKERYADGVYTASAGNMAQGVAWTARRFGVPCSVVVPDKTPATKLAAIERLGARAVKVPYDTWWSVITDHHYPGMQGLFIHPVADPAVIAGNGTVGLEILDELSDVDVVLVPFGGGGLSCGIASALRARRPQVKVYACEVDTAAPFAASLEAGSPQTIDRIPTFVDGIGGKSMLPEMWPLARRVLAGSLVVTVRQIVDAIALLMTRNRVVAEGAGGASVAAALTGKVPARKVVCVVSGGNIDPKDLAQILRGNVPTGPKRKKK